MPIAGTYTYPTSAELRKIAQDNLPRLQTDRPIFDILPVTTSDDFKLVYEQLDNYQGLMRARGLNGAPGKINFVGGKQFSITPGVYGEFKELDEERMTIARALGVFGKAIDIGALITEALMHLLQRRLDRIEWIGWQILQGTYAVTLPSGPNGLPGSTMATDSFPVQTYTAGTSWSTRGSAAPFSDFSAVKVQHRGHSVDFGTGAKAYANMKTCNNMVLNYNPDDLAGRRIPGLVTINNIGDFNQLLSANGCPTVVEYDATYLSDGTDGNVAGTPIPYIPDNTVIVVGKRPGGQLLGEFRMVRNINNPGVAPGAYTRVIVEDKIPATVEVHDGFNGGPVILYPSSVVVMSV